MVIGLVDRENKKKPQKALFFLLLLFQINNCYSYYALYEKKFLDLDDDIMIIYRFSVRKPKLSNVSITFRCSCHQASFANDNDLAA